MVSIVIDSDKQSTSKIISLRARPKLPHRLVKEAFLTDKLELNVFDSSPEEDDGLVSASNPSECANDCTSKSKQLRCLLLHNSQLSKDDQTIKNELCVPINDNSGDDEKKKELKPTSLFRHLTVLGPSHSIKSYDNFKHIQTCKVQPIRITHSESCDESNRAAVGKLAPLAKEEDENEEDENDTKNQLEDKLENSSGCVKPSQLSQFLKQSKIQRSDSDSSSKLKSFCLRRPKTMDKFCGSELNSQILLQPSRPTLASLRKNKSCTSSQTITESSYQNIIEPQKLSPDFNETCKQFLLERARPKKPTNLLLRQNSIDMSGQESAIGDNESDTSPGISPVHYSRSRRKVARSNTVEGIESLPIPIFMKHALKSNLVQSTDALNITSEIRRSISNESRNINSELNSSAVVSDHETTPNIFNISNASPHSDFSSPCRTSPTQSNVFLLTSPNSSKSKISKKKSSRMAASLVKNVPALFSGLKKSLPLQVAKSLSPPGTPNEDKKISIPQSPNPSTNRKTIKDLKSHSTSTDRLEPTVSRSDSKNKQTTQNNSDRTQQQKHINNHKKLHVTTTNQTPLTSTVNNDHSNLNLNEVSHTPREDHHTPMEEHHPPHQVRGRPSITPSLETCLSNVSLFSSTSEDVDKRDLILKEFLISEKQYVETLRMLVEKYMIPMKSQEVVDSGLTDEVFYKIQEIYVHHATLITFLAKALNRWNNKSTIGDIIFKNFSKQTVIESYVSFIEHFPRAEKVLQEISSKSSFQKFIEQCERETKVKLPLKAQLVKPAQRIPRYELLLKRLLENTPTTHPDFTLLRQAESAIHDLALKINEVNKGEKVEDVHTSTLKKLELLLITDLVSSGRCYVRNDMVTIDQMRDHCCMWLFTDLLLLSFVKRKNSGINKKATLLLQSINGNDYVENVKHKVWLKVPLTAVKIIHSTLSQDMNEKTQAKQLLETDSETLSQIAGLSAKLNCLHISVDEAIQSVSMEISRKLKEIQTSSASSNKDHYLLLYVATQDTLHQLCVTFSSADKQMNWELTFLYHKQKAETR